ncbi:hypothetical protein J3U18_06735 [Gilliamella sp. B3482]|uniref:hypothetical protein n=1 Tax=unclassified Gilliamella TaxID=2685620 RepID=UPI00080DFE8D|nr:MULTISPECIES: hypothetical protein [Gilliamella]MCX8581383.1 hypothetical protein [Gilliamella sp. B3482]OCF94659.1 hypothetical protein A9G08_01570 [Gilliamella apicola]
MRIFKVISVITFLIISLLFTCSFTSPKFYIKSYKYDKIEDEDSLTLKIFAKVDEKEYGYIHISKQYVTFRYYYNLSNFNKGATSVENIIFDYKDNHFLVINKSNNKLILNIECDKDIYIKANNYLIEKKKQIKDEGSRSSKDIFLGR